MSKFVSLKDSIGIFQFDFYRPSRLLPWAFKNYFNFKEKVKPRVVWTAKAKFLYRTSLLLLFLFFLVLWVKINFVIALIFSAGLYFCNFLLVCAAWLILKPYEIINRERVRRFVINKVAKLSKNGMNVIGITGSFGKTSTKAVLGQLLSQSLITPHSYNTLFGIYKVVDYELSSVYKSFVCEMGATKKGSISYYCSLVKPQIGILTGINETHYERFGSLDVTIKAKIELLESLGSEGTGIVNLDNLNIQKGLERDFECKVIGITLENSTHPRCDEYAHVSNISFGSHGTKFTLDFRNQSYEFTMPLIGQAHVRNTSAAIIACFLLNDTYADVKRKLANCEQIANRLEFKKEGSIQILNNTYSSNPDSFRENLKTLEGLEGPRVLVTPGMVELGIKEEELHKSMGEKSAKVCDAVILVGDTPRVTSLRTGLLDGGFNEKSIYSAKTSKEVEERLKDLALASMSILFENVSDLPANYL